MYSICVFFPLMSSPDLTGFVDLVYMSPNNWESLLSRPVHLYSLEAKGKFWETQDLGVLRKGDVRRLETSDDFFAESSSSLKLIYPSLLKIPKVLESLPEEPIWNTRIPEWRVTTGFFKGKAQTSYQGELFPLPAKASMLSFHPFIQYGAVENRLVILNATKSPELRSGRILFYDSATREKIAEHTIFSNSVTSINLNQMGFKEVQLPAILSPDLAGVPFGLGIWEGGRMLSMEHTHPPASFVLFGDRFGIQGTIKKKWFSSLLRAEI